MPHVAVIIRSPGHGEPVHGGKVTVTVLGLVVVITVADFERLQSRGRKPGDEVVHRGQSRMGHRDQSSGVAGNSENRFGRRAAAGHERRPTDPKEARERIVAIARVPGAHERIGELRAADAAAGLRSQWFHVDGIAQSGQTIPDLSHALEALSPLRVQELPQHVALGIDEVRQHVDVAAILDGRNLDAGYQSQAEPPCGVIRLRQPRTRVVIGDADRPKPALGRACYE